MRNPSQYSVFGTQAKIEMIKLGLTNKELARRLGYAESTLCDILKGRNRCERRIQEVKDALALAENEM